MKSTDMGEAEADLAFKAGADFTVASGVTTDATIKEVQHVDREQGRRCVVDLTGIRDIKARCSDLEPHGIDVVLVHRSIDEEVTSDAAWNETDGALLTEINAMGIDVIIVGSPRVDGNSQILAETCLGVIADHGIETEYIHIAGLELAGCTDCGVCKTEETCSIDDDLLPIYEKMVDAQAIIISAPTYFGSAPPEIKAVLDRTGFIAHRHGNRFARKVGSPISVSRRAGHNFTFAQLLQWFYINEIIVPGSSYWSIAIGRDPGEVRQDSEGMRTVEDLGRNIAWLTKLIWGEDDAS